MRILHLISSHRWTGAADPAAGLAREQAALGHDVLFACARGASLERIARERGLNFAEGLDLRGGFHPVAMPRDIAALRRILAEQPREVLHCHLPHDHWLAAVALAAPLPGGVKRPMLVRTLHRDTPPRRDPATRLLLRRATGLVITVSEGGRDRLVRALGLSSDRVRFIPGAVDLDRFRPGLETSKQRAEWEVEQGAPVVGMVAEMQPHRGHDMFIDTLEAVQRAVPGVRYLIVGRGEEKKRLRARMRGHRLSGHLIEAGYRKDDLAETYNLMNVKVILAQGSDGSCRAVLESMACGTPVIGARIGAIAETIREGRTGWLVEPGNRCELEATIIDALRDTERTKAMGTLARETVEREYSQRHRADATLEAYRERLAEAGW